MESLRDPWHDGCDAIRAQLRKRLEKARNGGRPWARKARQSLDHGPLQHGDILVVAWHHNMAPLGYGPATRMRGEELSFPDASHLLQHLSPMEISALLCWPSAPQAPRNETSLCYVWLQRASRNGGLPANPSTRSFNESTRQNSSTRGTSNRRLTVAEWRFHQALILAVQ
jgi:hypothetical protein